MAEAGALDRRGRSEEPLMLPTNLTKATQPSIRTTIRSIVIVTAILIVAMWAAVSFSVVGSRQAALDDSGLEGRNLMVAFREDVAFIMRGVEGEMDLIADRMRRERNGFDLYAWNRTQVLVSPGLAQATIIDLDGKLRQTTIDPHPRPIDLSQRSHFQIHLDGKFHGLYVGQPAITQLSGQPFLPISRRVDAEDGTFLGVLAFLITPSGLTALHKMIDLGPQGVLTLSGLDSVVRLRFSADSPDGTKGIGKSVAGGPLPLAIAEDAEGRYVRTSVIDGVSRVYAYGRVGSYPLVVTVGLEMDRELAAWRSYATTIVGMALGATLLLIGLAAFLIRRIFRDASTARATTLAITRTAEHDFLTGLPNRMLLNDRIGQAIAVAQRHRNKVAVMFMDLDNFKHINDSLGHQAGDKLLQSVAQRLVACVRGEDTVSRQGGDEFVALLSEVHQPEDAAVIARKMLQAVAETHCIDRHDLRVTASIGVSIYPDDGLDAETIVKNADTAMYQAKENGRHCYRFFEPAMNVRAVERQSIEEELRRALERREFVVHYQPKIDLRTGAITGAEALLGWVHPTRGLLSRAEFIPVAEDCGLIVPIGAWVLREVCRQARSWADAGLSATTMAVNVCAVEFRDENFLDGVFAILGETRLDPRFLELEMTESVLMARAESTACILQSLRVRGVRVTVDDFGTGYSSLSYLRKFPVDALKIDPSFVRQIGIADEAAPIVTAVISLARSLKLRVVAEGVETPQELAFLQAQQCDEAQGCYLSPPLSPERFARLLRTGVAEPVAAVDRSPAMAEP
jgi:diguanylate cyclase (GGDEF)-like protein